MEKKLTIAVFFVALFSVLFSHDRRLEKVEKQMDDVIYEQHAVRHQMAMDALPQEPKTTQPTKGIVR